MSKLDNILQRAKTVFVAPGTAHARWETTTSEDKRQIKDLMLGLADQVEFETNFTTGIPDAIALLRRKVNAL